jgi:transcriptional regulator with XRE-family HTH domain
MDGGPSDIDRVRELAARLGAELRRRRAAAGLRQLDLAERIGYDRSYLTQVETGRQVPAEQFIALCERALDADGALLSLFRELLKERETRRREALADRWRRAQPPGAALVPNVTFELAAGTVEPLDEDMERRPFFRLLGTLTGAALAETLGVELWDLARAMQASNVSNDMLDAMELSALRFHQVYAKVPPADLLPHVHEHLRVATSLLQQSQTIGHRRRLCSVAGHLAGLRGWLTFDLGDHKGAHAWYELALQPAREAENDALAGWVLGGRSLIPSYNADPAAALELIRRGQAHAGRSVDATMQAWLDALEARAYAGMDDGPAFRVAQDRANEAIDFTRLDDRRHGMDFKDGRLDVTYYEGTSLVTLQQPQAARPVLAASLAVQEPAHVKARSILLLAIATTHAQEQEIEEAGALAGRALDIPSEHRIGPIDQRARDLLRELEPWRLTPSVRALADKLATP